MKKGHQQHSSSLQQLLLPNNKQRRCTTLPATLPTLVVCSILLPLIFLLGLHRAGTRLGDSICAQLLLPLRLLSRCV
ncbi:unnamed protein product [Urochloa humidicola]